MMPRNYPTKGSERIHRLRAEQALGKPLPRGAVVHHTDGSKRADAPLVILQDNTEHLWLHARMRVQAAGGNPWTDKICSHCHLVKPKSEFYCAKTGAWVEAKTGDWVNAYGFSALCKSCARADAVRRRAVKNSA